MTYERPLTPSEIAERRLAAVMKTAARVIEEHEPYPDLWCAMARVLLGWAYFDGGRAPEWFARGVMNGTIVMATIT